MENAVFSKDLEVDITYRIFVEVDPGIRQLETSFNCKFESFIRYNYVFVSGDGSKISEIFIFENYFIRLIRKTVR